MMARKSKIDEDCEELSVVADPWNLKLNRNSERIPRRFCLAAVLRGRRG